MIIFWIINISNMINRFLYQIIMGMISFQNQTLNKFLSFVNEFENVYSFLFEVLWILFSNLSLILSVFIGLGLLCCFCFDCICSYTKYRKLKNQTLNLSDQIEINTTSL